MKTKEITYEKISKINQVERKIKIDDFTKFYSRCDWEIPTLLVVRLRWPGSTAVTEFSESVSA